MRSTRAVTKASRSNTRKPTKTGNAIGRRDHAAAKTNIRASPSGRQIKGWRSRRCPECRFCNWYRVDSDVQQPFCDNVATKDFKHPIDGLHPDSSACKLFKIRDAKLAASRSPVSGDSAGDLQAGLKAWHPALLQIASLTSTIITLFKFIRTEISGLF
jgi:hypothetical protein